MNKLMKRIVLALFKHYFEDEIDKVHYKYLDNIMKSDYSRVLVGEAYNDALKDLGLDKGLYL